MPVKDKHRGGSNVELGRKRPFVVNIDLYNLQKTCPFPRQRLHDRSFSSAVASPGRPELYKHGARPFQDFPAKTSAGRVNGSHRKINVISAFAAFRMLTYPLLGNAVDRPALAAPEQYAFAAHHAKHPGLKARILLPFIQQSPDSQKQV